MMDKKIIKELSIDSGIVHSASLDSQLPSPDSLFDYKIWDKLVTLPKSTVEVFTREKIEHLLKIYGVLPGGRILEIGSSQAPEDIKMAGLLRGHMVVADNFSGIPAEVGFWVLWGNMWNRTYRRLLIETIPDVKIEEIKSPLAGCDGLLPSSIQFPSGGKISWVYGDVRSSKDVEMDSFDCVMAPFVCGDKTIPDDFLAYMARLVKSGGSIVLDKGGYALRFPKILEYSGINKEIDYSSDVLLYSQWSHRSGEMIRLK